MIALIIFICLLLAIIAGLLYIFFYKDYKHQKRLDRLEQEKLETKLFDQQYIRDKYYGGLSNQELKKLYKINLDANIVKLFEPIMLNKIKCALFGLIIKSSYVTESHTFLEIK
jgi:hypothetical protein